MKEQDFIRSVNQIHAAEGLKAKVMSGRPAARRGGARLPIFAKCAVSLAAVAVLVLGVMLIPQILKPVGTVAQHPQTNNGSSSNGSGQPGFVNGLYQDAQVRNILLLGVDEQQKGEPGRSDGILLLSIDQRKGSGRWVLTTIPRDFYVEIPKFGENKINEAYRLGGAELSVKTVEESLKIKIDDYAAIDFNACVKAVDRLGGVPIKLSQQEANLVNQYSGEPAGKRVKAGGSVLSGKQALYYCRIRQLDSDIGRTKRIQTVMQGIIEKSKSLKQNDLAGLAADLLPFVKDSSLNLDSASALALKAYAGREYPVKTFSLYDELNKEEMAVISHKREILIQPDLISKKLQESILRNIYRLDVPTISSETNNLLK